MTSVIRSTITTVLTIPPVITDRMAVSNVQIKGSDTNMSVFPIIFSISPPPLILTDPANPSMSQKSGVPLATRQIFPPPYSESQGEGSNDRSGKPPGKTHTVGTHSIGAPGPLCTSGCGIRCIGLFCKTPCLLNCLDGWSDPLDPSPPDNPNPNLPGDPTEPDSERKSDCSTSTLTNYYVSCASSSNALSGCTTTSSALTSGCNILASTRTSSSGSCNLVTISPDDDQGQDGVYSRMPQSPISSNPSPSTSTTSSPVATQIPSDFPLPPIPPTTTSVAPATSNTPAPSATKQGDLCQTDKDCSKVDCRGYINAKGDTGVCKEQQLLGKPATVK